VWLRYGRYPATISTEFSNRTGSGSTAIPLYRAIRVFIIENLLRTSGISRDKYFDLLKGV